MTGELEKNKLCPLCGGHLRRETATIPFVFTDTVVLAKDVPAEVCTSCHEPYVPGKVMDRLTELLNQLRSLPVQVSIISYAELQPTPTATPK